MVDGTGKTPMTTMAAAMLEAEKKNLLKEGHFLKGSPFEIYFGLGKVSMNLKFPKDWLPDNSKWSMNLTESDDNLVLQIRQDPQGRSRVISYSGNGDDEFRRLLMAHDYDDIETFGLTRIEIVIEKPGGFDLVIPAKRRPLKVFQRRTKTDSPAVPETSWDDFKSAVRTVNLYLKDHPELRVDTSFGEESSTIRITRTDVIE